MKFLHLKIILLIEIYLNAEFQRITRRNKKPYLSNQCKGIEENNRMGKTRDLVKKIRDTKGTFHAKMDSIKDRNGREEYCVSFLIGGTGGGKN